MSAALALVPARLRADEVARDAVRMVVVDRAGLAAPTLAPFAALPQRLRAGDLLVVNDAATLPASLGGTTLGGAPFELRLVAPLDVGPRGARLRAVVLGAGDFRIRTEDRPAPPPLGDAVLLAGLHAHVARVDGRHVVLDLALALDDAWQWLYAHGRPVQYAHRTAPLALWDVQTGYAARPWALEMPSAGRPLTWSVLLALRRAGIRIATLTHAAGLSAIGDPTLDRALPWPERFEVPAATVAAIAAAHAEGGRVVAVGTSVVRALEAAALQRIFGDEGGARAGTAHLRIGPRHVLRVVDGVLSGLHVPGESHHELLAAFAPPAALARALDLAVDAGLSAHELGDVCLLLGQGPGTAH